MEGALLRKNKMERGGVYECTYNATPGDRDSSVHVQGIRTAVWIVILLHETERARNVSNPPNVHIHHIEERPFLERSDRLLNRIDTGVALKWCLMALLTDIIQLTMGKLLFFS